MEKYKQSATKFAHGCLQEVVVYERFQLYGFDGKTLVFWYKVVAYGGGCTWRLDGIIYEFSCTMIVTTFKGFPHPTLTFRRVNFPSMIAT